jgi:biopolymer transport protein ExbD
MRSRRHVEELGETGIDLAPMLDFVLNLLIFFIITTSFVREAGITVNRPDAVTAEHKDSGNILVAITANGDIWMDRRRVDLREVRPTIERLHVERPDDTVVVVADKGAHAGLLGEVMDEVQLGGIREVAIAATAQSGAPGS